MGLGRMHHTSAHRDSPILLLCWGWTHSITAHRQPLTLHHQCKHISLTGRQPGSYREFSRLPCCRFHRRWYLSLCCGIKLLLAVMPVLLRVSWGFVLNCFPGFMAWCIFCIFLRASLFCISPQGENVHSFASQSRSICWQGLVVSIWMWGGETVGKPRTIPWLPTNVMEIVFSLQF